MVPLVCGIAGPSGSGKSTLAGRLQVALEGHGVQAHVLSELPYRTLRTGRPLDYTDRDPRTETPENVDAGRLCEDIRQWQRRLEGEPAVVVVDHYLLLALPPVVDLVDVVILLQGISEEECKQRRIAREQRSPAQSAALAEYYSAHVWPSYQRYTAQPALELLAALPPPLPDGLTGSAAAARPICRPAVHPIDATPTTDAVVHSACRVVLDCLVRRGRLAPPPHPPLCPALTPDDCIHCRNECRPEG
eukprot:EG_transcript_26459